MAALSMWPFFSPSLMTFSLDLKTWLVRQRPINSLIGWQWLHIYTTLYIDTRTETDHKTSNKAVLNRYTVSTVDSAYNILGYEGQWPLRSSPKARFIRKNTKLSVTVAT